MKKHHNLLRDHQDRILGNWLQATTDTSTRINQLMSRDELQRMCSQFLQKLQQGLEQAGAPDLQRDGFAGLREFVQHLATDFAERGVSPSETASYIFSLKQVLFPFYQDDLDSKHLAGASWEINNLIDQVGLFSFESFSLARERIIKSQGQALAELSTPVIQVWEGIVALPLVGAIDSIRAKEIMEKLLESVIQYQADIVIIDITGVPIVDTQVANRLMRTVESVRLLGTRSIVTGINPAIAQTLVQLGVDLGQLNTKASLRTGLKQAFRELKLTVRPAKGSQ